MFKYTYQLRLISPAFLGGADQKGVWRTPPLKALTREWWRIAVAPAAAHQAGRIKREEASLFGTAADDTQDGSRQSRVRFALAHWNEGTLTQWEAGEARVAHPEVKDRNTGKERAVGAELYLGYGPLVFQQGTNLKNGAALQAGELNTLKLAGPESDAQALATTVTLAHWFGTIGGRSRNGWGSLSWEAQDDTPPVAELCVATLAETGCLHPLAQCLKLDWPHAIGSDALGPLVWQGRRSFANWRDAMKFLAEAKIAFRTELGFVGGQPHREPQARHVLAYPVTNHKVPGWEGQNKGRLANSLRFKLHGEPDGKAIRVVIYHTPCKPTLSFEGIDLLDTWQRVHRLLDANPGLARLA